jgi:hypothetical protein
MGFSLLAEALLAAHLQHASWTGLIPKFGYSVGFLIVILGRQRCFGDLGCHSSRKLSRPRSRACVADSRRKIGITTNPADFKFMKTNEKRYTEKT